MIRGYDLVSIESKKKNDALTRKLKGYREYMSTYYDKLNSYAMYQCIQIYIVKSNLYVISYSFAADTRYFWTAGTNLQQEKSSKKHHVWFTTAETFSYSNWNPGQPDNNQGNEHCVHLWNNGGWNDLNCETKMFFICQKLICP